MHRSYLFAPGHNAKLLRRVFDAGADAVMLDLEDAVPPDAKQQARAMVAGRSRRPSAWVRINAVRTDLSAADLDAVAGLAAGIRIPKAESADDVQWVPDRAPGTPLICAIESARGLLAAPEIAAVPGVRHLSMGGVDLRRDLGAGDGNLADAVRALAPRRGLARRRPRAADRQRLPAPGRRAGAAPAGRVRPLARLLRQVRDPPTAARDHPRRVHPHLSGNSHGRRPCSTRLTPPTATRSSCRTANSSTSRSPTAPGACWSSLADVRQAPEHRGDVMAKRPSELTWTPDGRVARVRLRGSAVLASPMINRGTAFTLAERQRAGADRAAARRGVHAGRAAAADLRPVPPPGRRPGEVGVPGQPARPQRGAVLQAAVRAHRGDAADRLHPDGRAGDRAVQPRVPPPARGVPVGRPPRGRRAGAAQHRPGRRRRRPARGHRLRGHPRASATRAWAASRSRSASSPSTPRRPASTRAGCCRWCWTWAPTTSACSTTRCTWASGTPGSATSATTSSSTPTSRRVPEAVPARDAALGGLRRVQRPPHPGPVRRPGAARSTTTCRAPPRSCWPPRSPRVRAAGARMRDQRVVIHGAGTAGLGIADMMRDVMVREGLSPRGGDRAGSGRWAAAGCSPTTTPRTARLPGALRPPGRRGGAAGPRDGGAIGLADVVARSSPTMLIGTSTQAGRVHRADRPRHGRAHRAADHHAAVQPDLEGRGAARRRARLDRRPRAGRHRQPVRPGRARRRRPTTSPRPTTRWSSPASGSASPSPGRAGSPTA